MDADFWHERWQSNRIAFHQDEFNRHLLKHWSALDLRPGARVLVPFCGKSRDLIWLAAQGHEVVGCEISRIAVKAFFDEADLAPQCVTVGPVEVWTARSIRILLGDFFSLDRTLVGDIQGVYDRAALIACPASMRPGYVETLARLTPAETLMLLIALEYPQDEMNGPPFSVPEPEIHDLLDAVADVELVEQVPDALQHSAQFRQRGLSRLREKVYRLRRK